MKRVLLPLFLLLPLLVSAQKRHEYIFDFTNPFGLLPKVELQDPDYNGAEISLQNTVFKTADGMVSVSFKGRDEDGRGGVFKTGWMDETTGLYDHFLFIARGGEMRVTANGVQLDSLIFSPESYVGNLKLIEPSAIGLVDARNESWFSDGATGVTELLYRNYGQVPEIRSFKVIYRSPMDVLEPFRVTPADKSEVHSIETIELSFAQAVKLGSNAKFELTGPRGFNPVLMNASVVGNKVVLSLPDGVTIDESVVARRGDYTLTIAAQSIIGDDEDGYYNKKTVYTFKVVEAFNKFEKVSVWPDDQAEQVVEIPNSIIVGFPAEVGKFSADELKLVDREGKTVRTLKAQWLDESEYVEGLPYYKHDKDIYTFVKFVFSGDKTAAVKATGIYQFTVPEGFIWNNEYDAEAADEGVSAGARFNPEFTITYNVNGVVYPSDEVLQAAKDLLAATGAGYPAANSPARLLLQGLVEEGVGADAVFEEAMAAFYAETVIELPKDGYYLLSAVDPEGNQVYVGYDNGKVILTRAEADAAHLLATVNQDGTIYFETPDHKFLTQMMPGSNNVSAAKGKANNLTFGRLVLKDDEGNDLFTPQQLFGLWSINGIIATNDEGVDVTAYALVNLQSLSFGTDRDKSLRYFSTSQTNAFRLTETDAPIPAATYTLDPAPSASLEALQRIVITFTNVDDVKVVDNAKTLITLVGTNALKYNPSKVSLVEGSKNKYLLYFEEVKAGSYTLTIPKGTFTWTYDERVVPIAEIKESYTVRSGIDFNYDFINRYRTFNYDQLSIDQPISSTDLGTFRMFVSGAELIPDPNRTVLITDLYEFNTIARGHFELDPTFDVPEFDDVHGIRFVLDEPKSLKMYSVAPDVYQYKIPAATFGDAAFGQWLKDPQSVSKRDCHVNPELTPFVRVNDDLINMILTPAALSSVHSLSEITISFPNYEQVEFTGSSYISVMNTMTGEYLDATLERVEGTGNQFRFVSTEQLLSGNDNDEYQMTFLRGAFKCGTTVSIPSYNDMSVYFFGKAGGGDAIESVDAAQQQGVIFDLSGRRVKDMNKAGIYIVGGRKVVVK